MKKKKVFRKILYVYLMYILVFAVLLFTIQKPKTQNYIEHFNQTYPDTTNSDRVLLLEGGEDAFDMRINLMENAKETMDIVYYTVEEGMTSSLFMGAILDAADRGVQVRLILDGVLHGIKGELKDLKYTLSAHPNITFKVYEPLSLINVSLWNKRLHDKIMIIDGNKAIIGGRNIGDKYFVKDNSNGNYTKDRDVLIYDAIDDPNSSVKHMQYYYNKLIDYDGTSLMFSKLSKSKLKKARLAKEKFIALYDSYIQDNLSKVDTIDLMDVTQESDNVRFIYNPIGQSKQEPWILEEILRLAKESDSILVQSPYVIPSRRMINLYQSKDLIADKFQILTNSYASSPNVMAMSGYAHKRKDLSKLGFEIHELQSQVPIHAKSYIFDNNISVIGSYNLDARSTFINTESMVIIEGEGFTDTLQTAMNVDLENSLILDKNGKYIKNNNVKVLKMGRIKSLIIKFLSWFSLFFDGLL